MTLLEAIHVYLTSKSAITTLVGSRIYRVKRPQGSGLPAITYQKVSGSDELYQEGTSTLGEARVRIDCLAVRPDTAESIRDAVRDECQRYSGTITSNGETVTIVLIRIEDDSEEFTTPVDKSDVGTYLAAIDLHIWWRPVAPNPA